MLKVIAIWTCLVSLVLAGFPAIEPTVGKVWPKPSLQLYETGFMTVNNNFKFTPMNFGCAIMNEAFARYLTRMFGVEEEQDIHDRKHNEIPRAGILSSLDVYLMSSCESQPHLHMDEAYELRICTVDQPTEATLTSNSVWGVLRGLETFHQLLLKESLNSYNVTCTEILDAPRFTHRGIMLDTARHYLPVSKILENLDLMEMNKMNVFHWHVVDDQSFPYTSAMFSNLTMGAWDDEHVYTSVDYSTVLDAATGRGIRVVMEFDSPGHTRSWGVGQPDLLTECYTDGQPDGTYGPIDPSKEENFEFLNDLLTEVTSIFPEKYIHLGGDEVPFGCWLSNPDVLAFMSAQGIASGVELENYYISRLLNITANLPTSNGYIVWEEVFDNGVAIAADTVVQVWKYEDNPALFFPELANVTIAGYQAILSSCYYLNYISYGVDWHKYYECDPHGFSGTAAEKQLVLGGEAAMWAEYVDATNLISRLWPRASAVAEKLWSVEQDTQDADAAAARLEEHRCRLLLRGYDVQPLGPSYCPGEIDIVS